MELYGAVSRSTQDTNAKAANVADIIFVLFIFETLYFVVKNPLSRMCGLKRKIDTDHVLPEVRIGGSADFRIYASVACEGEEVFSRDVDPET